MMPNTKPIYQLYLMWALLFIFLPISLPLLCTGDENSIRYAGTVQGDLGYGVGCGSNGERVDLVNKVHRSLMGCTGLVRACAHSDSFCFLSMLPVSLCEEDGCEGIPLKAFANSAGVPATDLNMLPVRVHELSRGKMISCSLIDDKDEMYVGLSSKNENANRNYVGQCEVPVPPDSWILGSSAVIKQSGNESSFVDLSLSHHVDIHPPLLDWGINNLYSPSFAYLTVTNMNNGSNLYVYKPYSSDVQFYLHDFEELSLEPGEAATIKFVFLPRQLGSLHAHVVLQTSFGGFVLNAMGVAVESPFRLQSLVGFEFSKNGRITKGLSIYNPFDDVIVVEEVMVQLSLASGSQADHLLVSCRHMNSTQHYYEEFDMRRNLLGQTGDGYDKLLVEMTPQGEWEIPPREYETFLDMTLVAQKEGNVTGFVCIHWRSLSNNNNKLETIIMPLEFKRHHTSGYHATTGSFAVSLDPIVFGGNKNSILVMSLRNDAPELLSVLEITELSDGSKLFGVKYVKSLILYAETLARIALITCPSRYETDDISMVSPEGKPDCKLRVVTNHSEVPYIDINCQDLEQVCSMQTAKGHFVTQDDSDSSRTIQHGKSSDVRSTLEIIHDEKIPTKPTFLRIMEANEFILRDWKTHGTLSKISILEEHELIFSKVEVGSQCSKWITVRNPSQQPVVIQLLLNTGVMIHHCKAAEDVLPHAVGWHTHPKPSENLDGFFLPMSATTEAYAHPFESIMLGPIVFRPSDRCTWSSSALVKNNISGVEWLPLQGTGASNFMVLLENSRAIHKVDFNINWPIPLDISSDVPKSLDGNISFTCVNLMSKELKVKNVGELPVEVVKLQVSGMSCELDGFTVHTCKGFALSPGESARLHISYQPDFSAAVISRDLELTLPSGTIVIPMRASVPIFMMKLCRKSFLWSFLRMLLFLVFICVSVTGLLSMTPHVALGRSGENIINGNTISAINKVGKPARIHRSSKNVRAPKDDIKSEVVIIKRYSDEQNTAQDIAKIVQTKQDVDCREGNVIIPTCSELISKEDKADIPDTSKSANLTIKTGREKGKRKKRRASGLGSGLASKLEVCSSHSGNSTPSSPLSPSAFTPKHVRAMSPDASDCSSAREPLARIRDRSKVLEHSLEGVKVSDLRQCRDNTPQTSVKQFSALRGQMPKPVLTPSATFPSSGWRAPVAAAPVSLASASPVAPYARAPGSNLSKDKLMKRNEEPVHSKEFTYDIWGDHLSDHIMGRSKEHSPRAITEASEGNSLSFFARGPQALMKMSPVRSMSPGPKLPSYDIIYDHRPIV